MTLEPTMTTELKLLLDTHMVRQEIQDFLVSGDVQGFTVSQFAVIVTKEDELVKDVLKKHPWIRSRSVIILPCVEPGMHAEPH